MNWKKDSFLNIEGSLGSHGTYLALEKQSHKVGILFRTLHSKIVRGQVSFWIKDASFSMGLPR